MIRTSSLDKTSPISFSPWLEDAESSPRSRKSESEEHDGQLINGEFIRSHGMSWFITSLFLVGDMAGGGIVALPTAVQQCGFYLGITICVVMAFVCAISAIFLGWSWDIMPRQWREYRSHCRKPYAELGYRALGQRTRTFVSVILNVTQFGTAVVFLLLSSKNVTDLVTSITPHGPGLCTMLLVLALILLPLTLLKSPEEFWWAVVAGMCSTAVAVVLIIVGSMRDSSTCHPVATEPQFHVMNLFVALGTIVFTFGGHAAFPTLQHDMRRPKEFQKSAIVAFIIICVFYAPVVLFAHLSYGDSLRESVIPSIQTGWIQKSVNMMIALHCMLTLTLMANPLNQEAEEFFRVPQEFGRKRVILRTLMMVAVVFVAESVPNFGPVLNLMGASTFTLMCIILPSVFYVFLSTREKKIQLTGKDMGPPSIRDVIEHTDRRILIACTTIVVLGFVCGGAATFSALREMTNVHLEVPCYIRPFLQITEKSGGASTNCCGPFQNITVFETSPEGFCTEPDHSFYG